MKNRWAEIAPRPRGRAKDLEWDVFVSYRSVNRKWALALYDALRDAGFVPFLDQFVIPAGVELHGFLRENLRASSSGVVIWSGDAASSDFVKAEIAEMRAIKKRRPEFRYVLAKLDGADLPFLDQDDVYVDFSKYPEGPRGGELLRLLFGLVGQPLSDLAVRTIAELDAQTTALIHRIYGAQQAGNAGLLAAIAKERGEALSTTALPYSLLVDAMIAMARNEEDLVAAVEVIQEAKGLFPSAVRIRQLEALAHRRMKTPKGIERALEILGELYAAKHRDPETLGIFGATWMQRYKLERKRILLEKSASMYEEAFKLAPESFYNGINFASKLALLGQLDTARATAGDVLKLVAGYQDGADYWGTATHAEAQVLLGNFDQAAALFRRAVVAHATDEGSISTTKDQMTDLLQAVGADETTVEKVLAAFSLD